MDISFINLKGATSVAVLSVIASLFLTAAAPAEAATFKPINGGKSLVITGDVEQGDVHRRHGADTAQARRGVRPERILPNSPGGSIKAGLDVADCVEKSRIHAVVGRTDECDSICVVIFAPASHGVAFPTSRIGVHLVSSGRFNRATGDVEDVEDLRPSGWTVVIARLVRQLGVPFQIIDKMVATDTADNSWLDANDAEAWKIKVIR
jgi:hypothetical protein